ncbi:MAG TPA: ABC transporter permease [Acidimicrobiales bacterium]|nr:ABC transporter permease [Acidimicrobiales bacterium]
MDTAVDPAVAARRPSIRRFVAKMPWATRFCASWLIVIVAAAVFADLIPGLADPNYQGFLFGDGATNEGPGLSHFLGTDNNSRDILARIVYGARVSLTVALAAVFMGVVFGGFFGSLVGFVRGKTDSTVMAVVDVILAFPGLVLLLTVVTLLGRRDLVVIATVIGFLSIPPYTRVARANALSISRREFVTAARAIGTKKRTILFREVIPNVLPTLLAYAMVNAAVIILLEGALAFLGLSVEPPTSSWGTMVNASRVDLQINVWPAIWPSLALVFTVYSLNNVGDWLRRLRSVRSAAL